MKRFTITILLATSCFLFGQSFGQNKVQYREFDWDFISSPNFDVYYYGDQIELATFTMEAANEAYEQIGKHLRWNLKKRVPIIIYHSHNEFQQNNAVGVYMSEGIGGVTELFKNRVVIPFEGDYKAFRHVIHHELVHAMINDLIYGGRMQNVASGQVTWSMPLWANEGLAEYLSSNWDTEADMVIRDLAINERIPTVKELEYYLAYKGGQSVWRFIAKKYGREKIGEVFQSMKRLRSAEKGFKSAIGMDYEELTEQWHKYIKKEFYPDVAGRDEVKDIAKKLTDHKKEKNVYNISPSISPDGGQIAYLTNNMSYFDIDLMDALTGKKIKKLIKGSRSLDFEELKFLQPGITWSPDSKRIVFAAKSGSRDALYLVDVASGDKEKIPFDLDGVFSAAWSPSGKKLAFVGYENGASDIYVYDLQTKKHFNLTNDIYSDSEPSWSPDGSLISFVSDRGKSIKRSNTNSKDMLSLDYENKNIYLIDINTKKIDQITDSRFDENYPIFSNTDDVLFYTADSSGTWNLFRYDLVNKKSTVITNLLTGIFQLSLNKYDDTMVFSGYSSRGWDVYRMNNPLDLEKVDIQPTNYYKNKDIDKEEELVDLRKDKWRGSESDQSDYSRYIFALEYETYNNQNEQSQDVQATKSSLSKTENGDYIPQPYKTQFSLDIAQGQYGYNNVFGHQGLLIFYFSDLMGDHQISLALESQISLSNSDYYLNYAYLKNRTNYYFTLFHQADFFLTGGYYNQYGYPVDLTARMRHYGIAGTASRPLNKFNRLDFGVIMHNLDYKLFAIDPYETSNTVVNSDGFIALNPTLSYIFDNSVFGFLGPIDGFRQNTTLEVSPAMGKKGISFQKLKIDLRKYFMVNRNYSFASRLFYGNSTGKNPQKYFLGGMQNWLFGTGTTDGVDDGLTQEWRWRNVILDRRNESLLQDIYFSEFAYPLRGARFSERVGKNVILTNLEFRFPLIQYLQIGFPFPLTIGNILGHVFMDVGAAWDDSREFTNYALLQSKYGNNLSNDFSPWVRSVGYGIKLPIFLPWRIEAAYDWTESGLSKPQWYVSLGYDW